MMSSFAIDYYILVVVAAFGVIQFAASMGRLRGLLVIKSPLIARAASLVLVVAAFVWFFDPETRNINDYEGGLDGNIQVLYFFLGAVTAIIVTVVISSFVNARMRAGVPAPRDGLDALRHTTYFRALATSLRYRWKVWRA